MTRDVVTHVHLDAPGGVAGDMFAAALLDAWPDLEPLVQANLRLAGLGDDVRVVLRPHDDGVLVGRRFDVEKNDAPAREPHAYTPWRDLRAQLEGSGLPAPVRARAIAVFAELAAAEARVHGSGVDDVTFHEVGHWDSVADVVAAATLVEAVQSAGPVTWSVGPLPLGRGTVRAAHGTLPVPAPATVLLLQGFAVHDDGREGERVTPTGAAILRKLAPAAGIGTAPRVLDRTGIGFGGRRLPGISNVLRVLAFSAVQEPAGIPGGVPGTDRVAVVEFDVDDQTGEELAVALDHLRDLPDVLDVVQSAVVGKKGRLAVAVRVLARVEALDAVTQECLRCTTTLGVRTRVETRAVLARRATTTSDGVRVKVADRPGGATAKAEMDDVGAGTDSRAALVARRRRAEAEALEDDA